MGYRHYFYEASREEIDKVKNLNLEQLLEYMKENHPDDVDESDWFSIDDVIKQKQLFCFGKLYYEDTAERIYDIGVRLFSEEDAQNEFADYMPYVVGKEGLLEAINIFKRKILAYYKSLLEDGLVELFGTPVSREKKQEDHIKEIIREWEGDFALNLDEDHEELVNSWRYEYEIFDLVRILKSVDWEKNTILFYGR